MKTIICVLAGVVFLTGFTVKNDTKKIDGIWLGYYRSDLLKEKMVIKFSSEDKLEFYTGGVDEESRCDGSYQLLGDSISFTYKTPEGEEYVMRGQMSRRKNYVDGVWKANGTKGSFFLEKQDVEEKLVKARVPSANQLAR